MHTIRIGLGDEALQLPVLRLPFSGGADSAASPGGFFTSKSGEFGVVVDARLTAEEAQQMMTQEIHDNAPFIAAALAKQRQASVQDVAIPSPVSTPPAS